MCVLKGQGGTCQTDQPSSSLSVPSRGFVGSQDQGCITRAVLGQQDCRHSAHLDRVAQRRSCPVQVQAVYLQEYTFDVRLSSWCCSYWELPMP